MVLSSGDKVSSPQYNWPKISVNSGFPHDSHVLADPSCGLPRRVYNEPMQKLKAIWATFLDKRWRVRYVPKIRHKGKECVGLCDWHNRELLLKIDQTERQELGTTIHESLHGCFPWLDEDAVLQSEESIADLLWSLGWRKSG